MFSRWLRLSQKTTESKPSRQRGVRFGLNSFPRSFRPLLVEQLESRELLSTLPDNEVVANLLCSPQSRLCRMRSGLYTLLHHKNPSPSGES